MGIANFMKRTHKVDRFIALLMEQSELTVAGLKRLEKWLQQTEINAKTIEEMRVAESQADEVRRILIDELHNTFITPLDREDIFNLSLHIDDILDYAYSTVEEMRLLQIDADSHLLKMIQLNLQASEEIALAIQRLTANPRVSGDHARRAKKLENEVEQEYRLAIADLFSKVADHKHITLLLKRREVYRHVSNMADRVNKAADVLGMIVMKLT